MVVIKEEAKKKQDTTGRPDWCVGSIDSVISKAVSRGLGVTYSNKGHFRLFEPAGDVTIWEGELDLAGGCWFLS